MLARQFKSGAVAEVYGEILERRAGRPGQYFNVALLHAEKKRFLPHLPEAVWFVVDYPVPPDTTLRRYYIRWIGYSEDGTPILDDIVKV